MLVTRCESGALHSRAMTPCRRTSSLSSVLWLSTILTTQQRLSQRKSTCSSSQTTHPTSLTRSSTTPMLTYPSTTRRPLGGPVFPVLRRSPRTRNSLRSFGHQCSSSPLSCVALIDRLNRITSFFGDLKDGKHDGSKDDPRVCLIEVVPSEIRYWVSTSSAITRVAETAYGALTGKASAPGEFRIIADAEVCRFRGAFVPVTTRLSPRYRFTTSAG